MTVILIIVAVNHTVCTGSNQIKSHLFVSVASIARFHEQRMFCIACFQKIHIGCTSIAPEADDIITMPSIIDYVGLL